MLVVCNVTLSQCGAGMCGLFSNRPVSLKINNHKNNLMETTNSVRPVFFRARK